MVYEIKNNIKRHRRTAVENKCKYLNWKTSHYLQFTINRVLINTVFPPTPPALVFPETDRTKPNALAQIIRLTKCILPSSGSLRYTWGSKCANNDGHIFHHISSFLWVYFNYKFVCTYRFHLCENILDHCYGDVRHCCLSNRNSSLKLI